MRPKSDELMFKFGFPRIGWFQYISRVHSKLHALGFVHSHCFARAEIEMETAGSFDPVFAEIATCRLVPGELDSRESAVPVGIFLRVRYEF